MHLGNVFSALLSWLSVKSKGGKWLLRIEDIDPQRSKQQYADQIMEDLEWLGLTWDEGPYYQSERGEIYEEYLEKLRQQDLLYLSYKTRAERLAVSAPQENDNENGNVNDTLTLRYADATIFLIKLTTSVKHIAERGYISPLSKRGGESLLGLSLRTTPLCDHHLPRSALWGADHKYKRRYRRFHCKEARWGMGLSACSGGG